MKVLHFLIVPERPMSIQKHFGSEECKAGAAWEEQVASHHAGQSNALFKNDSV